MKKAFTLAEILIALVLIGVLTAILLPVAFHAAPDKNVMKFKKGHNTLLTVIRELVTSDEYYKDGDLGVKKDGSLVDSETYFCETFADIVNTKKVDCKSNGTSNTIVHLCSYKGTVCEATPNIEKHFDNVCRTTTDINESIVTADGIIFYDSAPVAHFGQIKITDADGNPNFSILGADFEGKRIYTSTDSNGFLRIYKVFCMDIDGINKGEDPFGYAIRLDGKVIIGQKANEWLQKSIQKND